MTKDDRRSYTTAVRCLQQKENVTPRELASGLRSRFDDFVYLHINMTPTIHGTANFLTWHRYYIWAYEKALRDECGYQGTQPYWNWGKYAADPVNSPIFDGSDTSMGGNGDPLEHTGTPLGKVVAPWSGGGGCVTTGPFKDMEVNLGPIAPAMGGIQPNGNGLSYNPRCLKRDVSSFVSSRFTTIEQTASLIKNSDDIFAFEDDMQLGVSPDDIGIHGGGHFTIGGDPGSDFYVSPGDPMFYLHHAEIDRIYWIWQNQVPTKRLFEAGGYLHMFLQAQSGNGTIDDPVEFPYIGDTWRLKDLLDTTDGPFCYIYE
ncbi:hypothetical protein AJ80_05967 [Polytolypa hystricis UAMH7299]|uniref:Tyrosinase copper-binding domain-containing protein n=1 Tax=Polytolypa hystricis (strain UAMH7299) TaxID=1447883 RepID=A0A2B7Y0Z4_POLH7|nr:hypothetical protein AJ80_05967 [Polytolypa hystricis UAMH7299]